MMWSKIRSELRELIVPELRDRIDVHCTHYRRATDQYGEAWITVDKQKVDGGGYFQWHSVSPTRDMLRRQVPALFIDHPDYVKPNSEDPYVHLMQHKGVFDTIHVVGSLKAYLSAQFDECFGATNPIVRAFSVVDRRLGKRRFEQIVLDQHEYPLVQFYNLRRELFLKSA